MIKLIASDLDGTIIDNSATIPQSNLKAIRHVQKAKIPFVICTGKTYSISKDICTALHADYGIFGNGSQIINLSTGEVISKKTFTSQELMSCFSVIEKYNLHTHAYTENEIITTKLLYMDLRNSILFPNKIQFKLVNSVFDYIKKENPVILKLILSSPSPLSNIKQELENAIDLSILHITKTGPYQDKIVKKEYEYLDISPLHATKGSALEFLRKYLNLEKKDILSIGDNLNDLDMFASSGISVAVGDAYEEVKKAVNYVTSNSAGDGGFAEGIFKYIPFSL